MGTRPKNVCARLGQSKPHDTVDVCGLPVDHDGPHKGRYHAMEWEDVPGHPARSAVKKIPGRSYITEEHGNIRGN